MITCCSHDLETTDILPVIIDDMSNDIRYVTAAPCLSFCPMADETATIVLTQCDHWTNPSVTLGCAAGRLLHWCCHGEH